MKHSKPAQQPQSPVDALEPLGMPNPRTEIVTITPAMARGWLANNKTNRALKKRQVDNLVKVITLGEWDACNGETLILSSAGDLLDGQHRLSAVVLADQPIVSLVVFNVDPLKRGTIDTGFKRTFADFLSMHGEGNATTLAAGSHVLHAYEEGTICALQRGMPFLSYETGLQFLEAHPFLRKAVPLARECTLLSPSWGTALLSLFLQRDSVLAEIYVGVMARGDFTADYPILKRLRERLIRNLLVQAKLPYMTAGAYAVKAWNATRTNTNLKLFRFLPGEPFPTVL